MYTFKATMFFLFFRWAHALDLGRALQKNMCFFLPSARIRLLPIFEKKQSISGDKKNFSKKKFQAMFFSSPSSTFF